MTKTCCTCKLPKPVDDFGKVTKGKKNDGQQYECKACRKVSRQTWYEKRGEEHRVTVARRLRALRDQKIAWLVAYLTEHPCVDCGEADIVVLDFDHVRGEKHMCVSEMMRGHALGTIIREVNKCEVRCANCHRRKTAKAGGYFRVKYTPGEIRTHALPVRTGVL